MVRGGILEVVLLGKMYKVKEKIFVTIIILIMSILSFLNLGYRNMWTDEAINVVTGRNIVQYGTPRVWDGKNLIGGGTNDIIPHYTKDSLIEYRYDFLPRYMAAFAQLFGKSNFCLRLPFVIIGITSAFLFYLLAKEMTNNKNVVIYSYILYAFSAQIIVYIRVAYYYSLVLFMMNILYLFFIKYIKTNKVKWLILYMLSLYLIYHTNHLFFGVALSATLLTGIIFFRNKVITKRFILAMLLVGGGILPFVLWRNMVTASYGGGANTQGIYNFLMQMIGYLWNIQAYQFPFITLTLFLIIKKVILFVTKKRFINKNDGLKAKRKTIDPYIFLLISTILINVFAISYFTYDYAARYLLGSISACYILTIMFIEYIFKGDRVFKGIVIIMLFTNLINYTPYFMIKNTDLAQKRIVNAIVKPAAPFYEVKWLSANYSLEEYLNTETNIRCYLYEYLTGVFSVYNDSSKGIDLFFEKYSNEGDSVYVYGNIADSVLYYTDLNLVYPKNHRNSNFPIMNLVTRDEDYIDWIIVTAYDKNSLADESLFWINNPNYECYVLNYYNVTCMPELWSYYFKMPKDKNKLRIYRNKLTTSDKIDLKDQILFEKEVQ